MTATPKPQTSAGQAFDPNESPSLRFVREQHRLADEYRANGMRYSGRAERALEKAPELVAASELDGMDLRRTGWVIDGILPTGLAILSGASKIGKSWLVLDMAISVASGQPAFGRITVDPSPVLYLALEDSLARLRDRQRKLLGARPVPGDLIYTVEWPNIDDGALEMIESWLDMHPGCKLVIIDTFGKIRGAPNAKLGIYQQDVQDLTALKQLADRRGICLAIVHHNRKMGADDAFDRVSGTTGFIGTADTILVLSRARGQKLGTLSITGRDIPDQGDLAVSFDAETGRWSILGEAAAVQRSAEQQAIFNLLLRAKEPMKAGAIADELGRSRTAIHMALSRMHRDGVIFKVGHGLYRAPRNDADSGQE